ncbi:MAG: T9SS type A sorting domain-containing protein, partial [Candidatus Aegiribacteria sp.]|nr:T9SS type A sorting domain-containing protein [Candidatus Aegiribacteria sp.]
ARWVSLTDIDLDGKTDFLVAVGASDKLAWWKNNGGPADTWEEEIIALGFDRPSCVVDCDINEDGQPDVLAAGRNQNEIAWWDVSGTIALDGYLESSILDLSMPADWQSIDWTSVEPYGTSVEFQLRSSNDPGEMGDWSSPILEPGSIDDAVNDQDRYIQYRVSLTASDPDEAPVLEDVSIEWQPYVSIGTESQEVIEGYHLYGPTENPVLNSAIISFTIPIDAAIDLRIYDISGRTVFSSAGPYTSGTHSVVSDDLAGGVYLIRFTAGSYIARDRFVVLQ